MSFQSANLQSVSGWVGRLLRLDLSVFDEVRSDPSATAGAVIVVAIASVFAGIGSWLWAVRTEPIDAGDVLVKSLVLGSMLQTVVWFLWVYIVYQVLVRGYGVRADFYELIRTMGFAFAPVALSILIVITNLAVPFGVASLALAVLLTSAAIQSASSAHPQQALTANITGFTVFAVVMGIMANIAEVNTVGGLAPGLFFFSLDLL